MTIPSRVECARRACAGATLRSAIESYLLNIIELDSDMMGYYARDWERMSTGSLDCHPTTAVKKLKLQVYAAIGEVLRRNATIEAGAARICDHLNDEDRIRSDRGAKTASGGE